MSKKNVVIVDYGHGNLYSIRQACIQVGYNPIISSEQKDIINADSLILPGVGAFKIAMEQLSAKDLIEPIYEYVKKGNFLMGVCLGMQLLFDSSEEFGNFNGLGLINGIVKKFPNHINGKKLRVPHIGWNTLAKRDLWPNGYGNPLENITSEDFFYFIHSFYASPSEDKYILSNSSYDEFEFCSSVNKENVFGFQFHPEKSGAQGLNIYKGFLKL